MSHGYHVARRDANEAEMTEAWRACGAIWIPQGEQAGFDGLLITRAGQIYFVEVKQMRAQHQVYYLTENERKMCKALTALGLHYEIVSNITQALALVGAE